jgi:hypothetical protein
MAMVEAIMSDERMVSVFHQMGETRKSSESIVIKKLLPKY